MRIGSEVGEDRSNATKIPKTAVAVSKHFKDNKDGNFVWLRFTERSPEDCVAHVYDTIIEKVLFKRNK